MQFKENRRCKFTAGVDKVKEEALMEGGELPLVPKHLGQIGNALAAEVPSRIVPACPTSPLDTDARGAKAMYQQSSVT